jgi:hypothetical protein
MARRIASFALVASVLCAALLVAALGLIPTQVRAADEVAYQKPAGDSVSSLPQAVPAPSITATPIEIEAQPALGAEPALDAPPAPDARARRAEFGTEQATREARQIADWIVDSADNLGLPFVILDKVAAKIFVFDAAGRIQGAAPALLGSARGDDSVPGIGDREFSAMPPETRTTPGGRFLAQLGMDTHGKDVVWVDYEAAVSIHRVINTKPKERRLQRLATPTPLDNRISYGCINVPVRFYEQVVKPAFTGSDGVVYVLPETRPAREVFNAYDVDARTRVTVR